MFLKGLPQRIKNVFSPLLLYLWFPLEFFIVKGTVKEK